MALYKFVSTWQLEAPIDDAWAAISDPDTWPQWWKAVKHVERVEEGDENGVGSLWRLTYRSHLPYDLNFQIRVTEIRAPHLSVGESSGDLVGLGRWELSADGSVTTVRYEWNVRTTEWWMNALSPVLRPVFSWNHNVSMRECSQGMADHLRVRLIQPAHGDR